MVLKSRRRGPDWSADGDPAGEAKCRRFEVRRGRDPWFDDEDEAAAICRGEIDGVECPMRVRCLSMALVNNEQFGVFGGFTLTQRRWIRKHLPLYLWSYPIHPAIIHLVPPMSYFGHDPGEEDIEEYDHAQKAAS